MRRIKNFTPLLIYINILIFILCFFNSPLFAQPPQKTLSYDKYVDDLDYQKIREKFSLKEWAGALPAFPFEKTRTGVKKTLIFLEKHHIPEKVKHIYDTLTDNGVYPRFVGTGGGGAGFGGGVEVEVEDLLRTKKPLGKIGTKVWAANTINGYKNYGGGFKIDGIFRPESYIDAQIGYKDYPQEDFFGVGNSTSLGDGFTFDKETVSSDFTFSSKIIKNIDADLTLRYSETNIFDGEKRGKGLIKRSFSEPSLPGLEGAILWSGIISVAHDTRDEKGNPYRGGFEKISFGYTEGMGDPYNYFKYRLETARFFPLWSEDRILALRFLSEFADEVGDRGVPFFELPNLGGFNTLRGYQFNRFFDRGSMLFNFEYRYNVWRFKGFAMEMALFLDEGQVYREISEAKFDRFKSSYGGSLRFLYKRKVGTDFTVGHSGEGTEVYLKFGTAF